jgi:hypothetical protein
MSRSVLPARLLLTLALLGGLPVSRVPAQAPGAGNPDSPETSDLLDAPESIRELAKAKYEAVHADPRQLARERLVAAREAYRARRDEFLAGRGTLSYQLDSSGRLLEAELAVYDRPGERVAALERNWMRAAVRGYVTEGRFRAARVPIADLAEVRYDLLGAEIAWVRARQGERPARPRGILAERFILENGELENNERLPDNDPEQEQEMAQDKREALLADPANLARQRLEAARDGYRARFEEFLSGRGTLDLLTYLAARVLVAELAVRDRPEDQVSAYESYWACTKGAELINDGRFATGRVPVADYLRTKYDRLDAELRWSEARARLGKSARSGLGPGVPSFPFDLQPEGPGLDDRLEVRQLAQAKREALRADPQALARQRLAAVRGACGAREEEFLAGRGTLAILFEESQGWLDSELAVAAKPAERAAAWERQWTRLWRVEWINEARFKAGRVPVADMMLSRCLRLDAEIHWAEARAALNRK